MSSSPQQGYAISYELPPPCVAGQEASEGHVKILRQNDFGFRP